MNWKKLLIGECIDNSYSTDDSVRIEKSVSIGIVPIAILVGIIWLIFK